LFSCKHRTVFRVDGSAYLLRMSTTNEPNLILPIVNDFRRLETKVSVSLCNVKYAVRARANNEQVVRLQIGKQRIRRILQSASETRKQDLRTQLFFTSEARKKRLGEQVRGEMPSRA